MGFKEEIKAEAPKKILLIVEDCLERKLKYFLEVIQKRENGKKEVLEIDIGEGQKAEIEVVICETSDEVQDVIWDPKLEISVAILDCAVPRSKGETAAYYEGIEIMGKIRRRNSNVSIILNTPYRGLHYDALPQNNVIYVSQNETTMSDTMDEKRKRDLMLNGILSLLRDNNKQRYPKSRQTDRVIPTVQEDKDRLH